MSAEMASSTETTIYVRLLDEGTDVWRPVRATRVGSSTYEIARQPVPQDESWSFQPGDIVIAEPRQTDAGLIAVALATQFDAVSWSLRRKAG
jgi:hypothetical protein